LIQSFRNHQIRMVASGTLLGLSAPGYGLWMLAWMALIPALGWTRKQESPKRIFQGGFWLGFVYHGLFCLWFFDLHPLTWLGFTEWGSRLVTLGGWLIIAVEGGLLGGLLMLGYKALKTGWARLLLFPMLWVLGFSMLNWTPMALPWALLEYTQAPICPLRMLAALVTGSGVTALVIFHNIFWDVLRSCSLLSCKQWMTAFVLAVPALIGIANQAPPPEQAEWPMPVAVIQANLPIEVIRSARMTPALADEAYLAPARNAHFPPGTLLIYPEEGVVPDWVSLEHPERNLMIRRLQVLAQEKQLYIATGVSSFDALDRQHNSIALIPPHDTPVSFYHKRRLVPFGEFTPYGFGPKLTELLSAWNVGYSAPYTPGDGAPLLQANGLKLGGLVCFELIDSTPMNTGYAARYRQAGARLLLNTSNLGWFHENPLLEAQFVAIGQMRAAETGLPLVIASNTGTSAIIAGNGQVMSRTTPGANAAQKSRILFYNGVSVQNSTK
jgi:apolipoprotein N-acyltransferase